MSNSVRKDWPGFEMAKVIAGGLFEEACQKLPRPQPYTDTAQLCTIYFLPSLIQLHLESFTLD